VADDLRPVDGPSCDDVRESLELLALDALDPAERDVLRAHLDGCAGCRAELTAVEEALGALLLLAPEAEVPPGFGEQVAVGGAGEDDLGDPVPAEGPDGRRRHGIGWVGIAAACVVVALVLSGLAVALGTVFTDGGQVAAPPETSVPAVRRASLLAADGTVVGSVQVDDAGPGLVMAVDAVAPGVPYDCVVRTPSGELVTVGSWTPAGAGATSWAVPLDPALVPVDTVLLVGPGGATLATATLA
jgi:hypothetical protein